MNILVDTSVWSLALRRRSQASASPLVALLAELVQDGRAVMMGPVRQEILSGVRDEQQFERLKDHLQPFSDVVLESADYELAAAFSNRCRAAGIQGSSVDFLICSVAERRGLGVLTSDGDFGHFAKIIPLTLLTP